MAKVVSFLLVCMLGVFTFQLSPAKSIDENRGGDFTLVSAEGPLSMKELRGKVVLLFFGYTACPSVCPISLATINQVFSRMTPGELKQSLALFISLDPERDTPEMLKQYTGYFHSNIVGLTDLPDEIARIAKLYGVRYEKKVLANSALGYVIAHSANIFVVDPEGKLQGTYPMMSIRSLCSTKSEVC